LARPPRRGTRVRSPPAGPRVTEGRGIQEVAWHHLCPSTFTRQEFTNVHYKCTCILYWSSLPIPSRHGERPRSAATGLAAATPTSAGPVGLGRAFGGDTLVLLLALGLHTVGALAGPPDPQHQREQTEEQNRPDHGEPRPQRDTRPLTCLLHEIFVDEGGLLGDPCRMGARRGQVECSKPLRPLLGTFQEGLTDLLGLQLGMVRA